MGEDFEGILGEEGTSEGGIFTPEAIEARNNYTNTNDPAESVKYGERHITENASGRNSEGEYTTYRNYPVMYEREIDSIIKPAPEIAKGKETNLGLSKQTQLIERNRKCCQKAV